MQSNSQERRDNLAPKAASADDISATRPEVRGRRAELHPVDDAAGEKTMAAVAGVVTDCLRLNIRKEPSPNGEVLTVIDALSEVMVDINGSSDAFYKVCTIAGIEGFCMKKYIALREVYPSRMSSTQ